MSAALATRLRAWSAALLLPLLAACASPPPAAPAAGAPASWTGRLALQVEGEASQSFSAGFELKGGPATGELSLFSPLGGTLAVMTWTPQGASLNANRQVRTFPSLEALAAQATGTPLPVAALFDWLAGTPTPVPGWQTDLSQLGAGRIAAKRQTPPPAADLRIALDR